MDMVFTDDLVVLRQRIYSSRLNDAFEASLKEWCSEALSLQVMKLPEDMHPDRWDDLFKRGGEFAHLNVTVEGAEILSFARRLGAV